MRRVALLFFVALLAGCTAVGGAPEAVERVKQSSYSFEEAMDFMSDTEAEPFTLPTRKGGTASLADYEGDILLLCFTEADNTLNRKLFDMLSRASKRDDLKTLLVLRGDASQLVDAPEADIALDADSAIFSQSCYSAQVTPVCYVIDRNGVIRIPVSGVVNDAMLEVFMDYMRALDE